jgi:hypothetical protein
MNRTAFDSGLSHLCDSLSSNYPKEAVANAWYGHLAEIPGPKWTKIVQSLVNDLDAFPRNLPRAVLAYVDRSSGQSQKTFINPDTGAEWTPEESFQNLHRLKRMMEICGTKDHPRRNAILGCAEASLREGDGTVVRRKWGGRIVDELDADLEQTPLFAVKIEKGAFEEVVA